MADSRLYVDIDLIDVDPDNPRGADVGDVCDLVASMRVRGQEDPIHLIPKPDGRFWLHEGHRRRKAMLELGYDRAWYVERHFDSDLARLLSQGTLHLHRVDFDPMAWARYLHRLYWNHRQNRQQLAHQLGRSTKWVRDTMSLVHLEKFEQDELSAGLMTKGEALWRLGNRRALRAGAPPPAPKTTRARERHFTSSHPLARDVKARCASYGEDHADRTKIGDVGCGACWEHAIRADAAKAPPRPALVAA